MICWNLTVQEEDERNLIKLARMMVRAFVGSG